MRYLALYYSEPGLVHVVYTISCEIVLIVLGLQHVKELAYSFLVEPTGTRK